MAKEETMNLNIFHDSIKYRSRVRTKDGKVVGVYLGMVQVPLVGTRAIVNDGDSVHRLAIEDIDINWKAERA